MLAFAGTLFAQHAKDRVAGTSLRYFAELDDGVYKGSKPKRHADFDFLQSQHIRYILEINFLPLLSGAERRQARKHGMTFISVPMNASPLAPSDKHVDRILCLLRDKEFHPIYFHCDLGRDRTSLIAALYAMYFKGMSPDDAWRTMKDYGFKDSWTLRGLKTYFRKQAKRVEEARAHHQNLLICPAR
jgi:Tyrosine phosphatase family